MSPVRPLSAPATTYCVELLSHAGAPVEQVVATLAKLFKLPEDLALTILEEAPVAVRTGAPRHEAAELARLLLEVGATVRLVAEESGQTWTYQPRRPAAPLRPARLPAPELAVRDPGQRLATSGSFLTICSKCGQGQVLEGICRRCGHRLDARGPNGTAVALPGTELLGRAERAPAPPKAQPPIAPDLAATKPAAPKAKPAASPTAAAAAPRQTGLREADLFATSDGPAVAAAPTPAIQPLSDIPARRRKAPGPSPSPSPAPAEPVPPIEADTDAEAMADPDPSGEPWYDPQEAVDHAPKGLPPRSVPDKAAMGRFGIKVYAPPSVTTDLMAVKESHRSWAMTPFSVPFLKKELAKDSRVRKAELAKAKILRGRHIRGAVMFAGSLMFSVVLLLSTFTIFESTTMVHSTPRGTYSTRLARAGLEVESNTGTLETRFGSLPYETHSSRRRGAAVSYLLFTHVALPTTLDTAFSDDEIMADALTASVRYVHGLIREHEEITHEGTPGFEISFDGSRAGHPVTGRAQAFRFGPDLLILVCMGRGAACAEDSAAQNFFGDFIFEPNS